MDAAEHQQIEDLHDRLHAMAEEDRRALDPICEAIRHCWNRERPPMMVLPNRVVALAALDFAKRYSQIIASQE